MGGGVSKKDLEEVKKEARQGREASEQRHQEDVKKYEEQLKYFMEREKGIREENKKNLEEQRKQFEKQTERCDKETREKLKERYEKILKQSEEHNKALEQQHKQKFEEHKHKFEERERQYRQERKKLAEKLNELESADFKKWLAIQNDNSIRSLLSQIGNKYPGSEMQKLRAEALDKFGIDSNKFNLGITGQSGSGKSTLINVLRECDDNDPKAAKVDVNECTDGVKGYPYPDVEHLVLYDLPGAGTTSHPVMTYFCDKRLYVFDCLLVVMEGRTRENDLTIAKFALEKGTPVVFVRSKFMNDFNSKKTDREYKNMKEDQIINDMLSTTKRHIKGELEKVGIKDSKVFIIDAHSLRKNNIQFHEHDLIRQLKEISTNPK